MKRTMFLGASLLLCASLAGSGCVVKKRASNSGDGGSDGAATNESAGSGDTDPSTTSGSSGGGTTSGGETSGGETTTGGTTTGGGPADPGLCCTEGEAPGCADDATIEQCVCGEDPFCCDTAWDFTCVVEVNEFGCGQCDVEDPGTGSGGGSAGGEPVGCMDDGMCTLDDDCVCSDCDADEFCSDPMNCIDDGQCDAFSEGCVCDDCKQHEECTD